MGWNAVDTMMLGYSVGKPLLVKQIRDNFPVRILKPLLSLSLIHVWLEYCRENHTRVCGSTGDVASLAAVLSFKLIDCETRDVVLAMGRPYVALSYLWGPSSSEPRPFYTKIPPDQPATIEDAIKFTRDIGFRYLWIDRYCINQKLRDEMAEQIPQMNLIYNCAELTIIAAAGIGPEHGLPGVRPRAISQAQGRVGRHFFVSTLSDPKTAIKESKWSTRGWTYQEALLSRRRLVFTDEQAYFECSGMYCCEVLDLPLSGLHTDDGQRFRFGYRNGTNVGLFPLRLGSTGFEVIKCIKEYCKRSLSNPQDILNGIQGILQAFSDSPQRVRHCYGVPILPRPPIARYLIKEALNADSEEANQQIPNDFHQWSATAGFCMGLCWTVTAKANNMETSPWRTLSERRQEFPTWSWAGWTGSKKWLFGKRSWKHIRGDPDLQVRVQLQDGRKLTLDEFFNLPDRISPTILPSLHISAWVTDLLISRAQPRVEISLYSASREPLTWESRSLVEMFHAEPSHPKLMAIHLARDLQQIGLSDGFLVMIVIETDEPGVYERVGIGNMTKSNLSGPGAHIPSYFEGWGLSTGPPPEVARSWREIILR